MPARGHRGYQLERPLEKQTKVRMNKSKNETLDKITPNSSKNKFNVKILSISSVNATMEQNCTNLNIGSLSVKCLVDSGSSLCCIKKTLLNTFDQSLCKYGPVEHRQVIGVSGKLIDVTGTV